MCIDSWPKHVYLLDASFAFRPKQAVALIQFIIRYILLQVCMYVLKSLISLAYYYIQNCFNFRLDNNMDTKLSFYLHVLLTLKYLFIFKERSLLIHIIAKFYFDGLDSFYNILVHQLLLYARFPFLLKIRKSFGRTYYLYYGLFFFQKIIHTKC